MKPLFQLVLPAYVLLLSISVHAHEVRPAYMEITEQKDGSVEVRWRQPIAGEYTLAIDPVLSSGWLDAEPQQRYTTANSLIKVWELFSRPMINF